MRRNLIGAVMIALLLTMTGQANAQQEVLFDFRTNQGDGGVVGDPIPPNTNFDPGNAGDTIALDAGLSVTIVDITAPEYDVTNVVTPFVDGGVIPVQTGVTLSSAAGDLVIATIDGQDALGIDNPSIDNVQNDIISDGNDSGDFNPGETITLTFDQDVTFTAIELESVRATDSFEVLVGGVSMLLATGDDAFLDDLGGLTGLSIAAGTEVTFAADGLLEAGANASSFRIETFTVLDSAGQEVLFDFRISGGNGLAGTGEPNFTNLDPGRTGEFASVDGLALTLVDITAPEYDVSGAVPVEIGTLSGAAGDNVVTNISSQDALGIQNPSISNDEFDLIGDGTESSDLNPGETVTFTFDQDVVFTSIELESVEADDTFDVLVDGVAVLQTTGDDAFLDDLGGLSGLMIPAGSEITFAVGGILAPDLTDLPSTSIRIETFTVEIMSDVIKGDADMDGDVDFDDIPEFIAILQAGVFVPQADADCDTDIDFDDIPAFIMILQGQ